MFGITVHASLCTIAFLILTAFVVHRMRRRSLLRRAWELLDLGEPRRARALARLGRRTCSAKDRPEYALCEANALLWEGAFTRAIGVLDARVPPNAGGDLEIAALLVRLECLLFDQRLDEARALFEAHAEMLRSTRTRAADGLVVEAYVAFSEGDLESAKAKFERIYELTTSVGPNGVAVNFALAAIAYRTGRTEDTRRYLTETILDGGDLFVARWAEDRWAELFAGEEIPSRERRSAQRRRRSTVAVLAGDLVSGASVLFLRRAPGHRAFTPGRVAFLLLLGCAVTLGVRFVDYEPGEEVFTFPLVALLAPLLAPLAFALTIDNQSALLRVLGGFYGAQPVLLAAMFFVPRFAATGPSGTFALAALIAVWSLIAVLRLVRVSVPKIGAGRLVTCGITFAAMWILPMHFVRGVPLFLPSHATLAREHDARRRDAERHNATAFAQSELLATEVGKLEPGRPGITDLFFIGGAGWAEQDVFLNEVRSARSLFERRFDTQGRSLLLSNDPSARDIFPLASNVTLRRAIGEVGARMNVEEDVLFLFLSSHGSTEGLALGFGHPGPFQDEGLEPEALAAMLDSAHIKWRVVVVAGCQTGVFATPLKNDFTLLATAASSDRMSYGCETGNAFTDFSRALFNEELARETSFPTAFRNAARVVGERESLSHRFASRPQVVQGAAIEAKLRELETRLAETSRPAASKPR